MISDELIQVMQTAQTVVVLTGAGVSAESGVPTFRDALTGLWENFDPAQLATPEAFQANPKLVWDWYASRREMLADVTPNAGHYALAELEQRYPYFYLITQNVDSLHQVAGNKSVIELHGNLQRVCCFNKLHVAENWDDSDGVPNCQQCGAMLRPDVVWFGEMLPEDAIDTAFAVSKSADVFISIGTSAEVQPAASLPVHALRGGATFIEINPHPTMLTNRADFVLPYPSGEVLPELVAALNLRR